MSNGIDLAMLDQAERIGAEIGDTLVQTFPMFGEKRKQALQVRLINTIQKGVSEGKKPSELRRDILQLPHVLNTEFGMAVLKGELFSKDAAFQLTPEEAEESAKIKAGLLPRASAMSFQNLDRMGKMQKLLNMKKTAAGQYFGLEHGSKDPLDQKGYDYATKELAKLEAEMQRERQEMAAGPVDFQPATGGGNGQGAVDTDWFQSAGPQMGEFAPTREKFIETVANLKGAGKTTEAKAYYDKWVDKVTWQ
ncbi:MAG: hypothetical protein CEE38_08450 [Planctomycetes bacterium B3_Pla]|nr:MAG: hypothetical protein CEE38_08450 [Planctomycetes bacterium B3_Pla]